jgi:hypothetical protein
VATDKTRRSRDENPHRLFSHTIGLGCR